MTTSNYSFRDRKKKSIFEIYDLSEDYVDNDSSVTVRRIRRAVSCQSSEEEDEIGDIMDKLPKEKEELEIILKEVEDNQKIHRLSFLREEQARHTPSYVDFNSIPICADITRYNFEQLRGAQIKYGGRLFDVIMMDPPWKLSTSQPSRGVAIQYASLPDEVIQQLPIGRLNHENSVLAIWAINAKYAFTVKLIQYWGYTLVDSVTWVKKTVNGKIAKGHGFYLQHAKETCLIGVKGVVQNKVAKDVIFSNRRGQSQKPSEIYQYLEALVPNGYYLEIFGRRNNLTNKWVTVGDQI